MFQLEHEISPLRLDPLERRRQKPGRLELPETPHSEIVDALSGGDPDHDPAVCSLHKQREIAGGQV